MKSWLPDTNGSLEGWSGFPWWKRLLLAPLLPFVFLAALFGVLIVLLPVALWNAFVWTCYWLRCQLTGEPIPPKGIAPPLKETEST